LNDWRLGELRLFVDSGGLTGKSLSVWLFILFGARDVVLNESERVISARSGNALPDGTDFFDFFCCGIHGGSWTSAIGRISDGMKSCSNRRWASRNI